MDVQNFDFVLGLLKGVQLFMQVVKSLDSRLHICGTQLLSPLRNRNRHLMRLATIAHLKRELDEGLLQVTLLTPKLDAGFLVHTPELLVHCLQINLTPARIETAYSTHP